MHVTLLDRPHCTWHSTHGHVEAASVLLETGAVVNATNDFGQTPLYEAIRKNRHDN
jgi:ankyrin repeat protein